MAGWSGQYTAWLSLEVRKLWYLRWLLHDKTTVTEARIFQSQKILLSRFKELQDYLFSLYQKPVKSFIKFAYFPEILQISVIFLFAYLKLPEVLNGTMSVGTFTFFISLLDRVANSASGLITDVGGLYENSLYVTDYFKVLNLPPALQDAKKPAQLKNRHRPPQIEFQNVSFAYPEENLAVLKNISFTIIPGENVAIVGPNGAGKTTIIKLLCRFYDVTEGEILINGVNIRKISRQEWYRMLGTLFQEFVRYDLTVEDNIVLGNPEILDRKQMLTAAEASGAAEFINKLPKKYDQQLGRQFENGVELSVGQWQKLGIARAFYRGALVLILDEPTSSLDAEAEYEVFNNLHQLYQKKTLIFISHRFSTVRAADKILVIKEGKIIEQGNHQQLLSQKGLYERMFSKQARGYVD